MVVLYYTELVVESRHKLGGEMVKHNCVHRLFRFLTRMLRIEHITVRKGDIFH